MSSERTTQDIDQSYLKSLESRLQRLKDPNSKQNAKTSKFLSDLESAKDHQLFQLLTAKTSGFDDDFALDQQPIEANWVQRKLAPRTCAINAEEKKLLISNDELESQIRKQLEQEILDVLVREVQIEKESGVESETEEVGESTESEQKEAIEEETSKEISATDEEAFDQHFETVVTQTTWTTFHSNRQ